MCSVSAAVDVAYFYNEFIVSQTQQAEKKLIVECCGWHWAKLLSDAAGLRVVFIFMLLHKMQCNDVAKGLLTSSEDTVSL